MMWQAYHLRAWLITIINNNTGDVLEYRHLRRWTSTSTFGHMVLPMNSGDSSRVSYTSPALTHVFSSPSCTFQLTNAPPTAAFSAIINRRKMRNIALGSQLVAIASTIHAAEGHQQLISPLPKSSSIPPSAPWGQSVWALTLPIST